MFYFYFVFDFILLSSGWLGYVLLIFVFFLLFAFVTYSHFSFHFVFLVHIFLKLYSPETSFIDSLACFLWLHLYVYMLFHVVNCHCIGIWFFVLIQLNNIHKLFIISSHPFIHPAFQPNLSAAFLFFILVIAFLIMVSVIVSFLYPCQLVIFWNSFSTLHITH